MLSEREDAQVSKESVSSRNLDNLEKRTNYDPQDRLRQPGAGGQGGLREAPAAIERLSPQAAAGGLRRGSG